MGEVARALWCARRATGLSALASARSSVVIAAGGPAGGFGAVIPPWLGNKSHASPSIGACVDCEPPKK